MAAILSYSTTTCRYGRPFTFKILDEIVARADENASQRLGKITRASLRENRNDLFVTDTRCNVANKNRTEVIATMASGLHDVASLAACAKASTERIRFGKQYADHEPSLGAPHHHSTPMFSGRESNKGHAQSESTCTIGNVSIQPEASLCNPVRRGHRHASPFILHTD